MKQRELSHSLVSANEWPVFSDYAIMRQPGAEAAIAPESGAHIVRRINLLEPPLQHEALARAIGLVRWGSTGDVKRTVKRLGYGQVREPELLDYAHEYGLLGVGLSYIVRAVQTLGDGSHLLVERVSGRLRAHAYSSRAQFGEASLTMLNPRSSLTLSNPHALEPQEWHFSRPDVDGANHFAYEIGSDDWWALYAEPFGEVARAIGCLHSDPSALELLLEDTFIRLPDLPGPGLSRSELELRSVSAIGALALDAMQGGLKNERPCADSEGCGGRFLPTRSDQRFCSRLCRDRWHKRQKYVPKSHSDGGNSDA